MPGSSRHATNPIKDQQFNLQVENYEECVYLPVYPYDYLCMRQSFLHFHFLLNIFVNEQLSQPLWHAQYMFFPCLWTCVHARVVMCILYSCYCYE